MQEGEAFLDKNLTEWKKPVLMEHFDGDKASEPAAADEQNGEGIKLSKFTTTAETAKVCSSTA